MTQAVGKVPRDYYDPDPTSDGKLVLKRLLDRQPFVNFVIKLEIKPSEFKCGHELIQAVREKFKKCSVPGCTTRHLGSDGAEVSYGFDSKGNVVCDCGHHNLVRKHFEYNGGLTIVMDTCDGVQITSDYKGPSGG
jgi:hypothetical protein